MKPLVNLCLITCFILASCAKNSGIGPAGIVTIGGATYNTITIGSQIWTSSNYTGAGGVPYAGSRLYTFAQATAINLPSGWRLPNETDFTNLINSAQGTTNVDGFVFNGNGAIDPLVLMSTSGWAGTNQLGFNAMPTGYATVPSFGGSGINALFWSSSLYNGGEPFALSIQKLGTGNPTITVSNWTATNYASIRFVTDN